MILCVAVNAAVDRTIVVDDFRLNAIHRPREVLVIPGGKSCNVARVSKTLGQPAVVIGWVGGHAGDFIEEELRKEGIQVEFIHSSVESRECISILDQSNGTLTEIYEHGREVKPEELEAFYSLFEEWLPKVQMVTLCGSLPPGVPVNFYAKLICMARAAGVRSALDTSGEALRSGMEEGRPDLLKCNRAELSELVGKPLESLNDVRSALQGLVGRLCDMAVITLGGAGAIVMDGPAAAYKTWLAQAPLIHAVSAVGSGDAFLAGMACRMLEGRPLEDALRLAIAAGSANALQIGAGRLRMSDVETLLEQVQVAALDR
jgi:tagatose 6-phosphate kinase